MMVVFIIALALELHAKSRLLPNTLQLRFMLNSNPKDSFLRVQNELSLEVLFNINI